jgi:hypothetical protein
MLKQSLTVGFDIQLTRDNLFAWLVRNDLLPESVFCPLPRPGLSDDERELANWLRIGAFAAAHVILCAALHVTRLEELSMMREPRPISGAAWRNANRFGAVALALMELCVYWTWRRTTQLESDVAKVAAQLNRLEPVLEAIDAATNGLNQRATTMPEVTETDSSNAAEGFRLLVEQCRAAARLAQRLGGATQSLGRGRPRKVLLAAIQQHLRRAGFTYLEIDALVARTSRGKPSTARAKKDRVRRQAERTDVRRFRPFDLSPSRSGRPASPSG